MRKVWFAFLLSFLAIWSGNSMECNTKTLFNPSSKNILIVFHNLMNDIKIKNFLLF